MSTSNEQGDPRIYMAAERTFLAWLRTAIALMAFGFVISRFGFFLRGLAVGQGRSGPEPGAGFSLALGLGLIAAGVVVCLVAAVRHRRYVSAIDAGRFREAFGSTFAFGVTALLVLCAVAMALFLFSLSPVR